jgi:iron complex outermembrane receptor protein
MTSILEGARNGKARLAATSLVYFVIAGSAAAGDLTVSVSDAHQGAIPAASVLLNARSGDRHTASVGPDGSARFTGLPSGEYVAQAEAPGFDLSEPVHVLLSAEDSRSITLQLGLAEVHSSVVVTASGLPQTTDEVSKALSVIGSETISLHADHSVGESLEGIPGLRVQQLGGPVSTTYFKVRGLRNADTAVLVDGMRLRDAAGTQGDASGVLQDLVIADTSRIEVLRGAGSALYGTNATGGVINLITDEGGGRTHGSILADGGSLGAVRGLAKFGGALLRDRVQYSLGVTHWNVLSGVDGNSPARNTSEQGRLTLRLSPKAWITARVYNGDSFGFVRISPRSVGKLPPSGIIPAVPVSLEEEHRYEAGTPISQLSLAGATFLPAAYNSDSTRAGHFLTAGLQFSARPLENLGFTSQFQHLGTTRNYGDGPAGPGSQPAGTNLSKYLGRIETATARMDFSPSRTQRIDIGYELESENFQNRLLPPAPSTAFFTEVNQRSNAIFVQDQLRFFDGRLRLAAAYRAQFFHLDSPTFDPEAGAPFAGRSFSAPPSAQTGDASAAFLFRRTATKIRAHAGRGYRAPSLYERFGTFFSGTAYTLYGDPSLRPDRSSSIDGGVDQSFWNSRVLVSATYYYTRLNEVIIFDTSGAVNPLTDPLGRNGGYRNTHGGIARGAELSAAVAASGSLDFSATYTYTDARQQIPLVAGVWQTYEIPRHSYSGTVTEKISPHVTAFFAFNGSTSYLASVSGRAFRFDGPVRGSLGVSYRRPLREFQALRIYTNVDNIFNQTYFENGFRTPGARFTSGTQFEF